MKNNIYKYANLVSTTLVSVLILMKWFTISAMGTVETHSFMTIPAMLNEGADFLTQIGGKSVAITVLILAGILEYMCIVSSALGFWGVWRTYRYNKRSRLVLTSQIVGLSLTVIALITVFIINVVSGSMLGDIISVVPTAWLIIAVVCQVVSIVSGVLYWRETEEYYIEEN